MARTELIEVRKKSWGKDPEELYLYEAASDETGAVKAVTVFRESESSNSVFVGRFESMDDFMRLLTTQFLKDEIEILRRVAYENGELVSNSGPAWPGSVFA